MGNVEFLAQTAAAKPQGGSSLYLFVAVAAIIGLMYFVMIRPQRNRQRAIVQAQNEIVPGRKVRTTAGMYATVVAIEDADVVLEVAPGVNVRYMRRAIMEVIPPETGMDVPEQAPGQAQEQTVSEAGVASEASATGATESGPAAQ